MVIAEQTGIFGGQTNPSSADAQIFLGAIFSGVLANQIPRVRLLLLINRGGRGEGGWSDASFPMAETKWGRGCTAVCRK